MPKHSKRFSGILENIDRSSQYEPLDAIRLVKSSATAKFDETVELHLRMGPCLMGQVAMYVF